MIICGLRVRRPAPFATVRSLLLVICSVAGIRIVAGEAVSAKLVAGGAAFALAGVLLRECGVYLRADGWRAVLLFALFGALLVWPLYTAMRLCGWV